MTKNISFPGIVIALSMMLSACDNSPVNIYTANPHYFMYKGKPLVLITSDQHYGAVIDRDFDFVKYLEYLAANRMNLTRIYPGGMFEAPDKYLPGNPLGPLPGRQLLPWLKSDQPGANPLLTEPGQPSYKFNLDSWNSEYFVRLKAFVECARQKDIIVEIAFFNGMYADCWPLMAMYYGNNIQNVGQYDSSECGLFTSADVRNQKVIEYQKAYIKKITTELNGYSNIIFDICDEPSLQGLSNGSITVLPDSMVLPWVNIMKEAFIQAEELLPKKHLLGQTVQNLSPDLSNESWCSWLPTEYVKPAEKALSLNYRSNKPLINVESNYFGFNLSKNPYTVDAVRVEGWWFMLGGGAGCINLNGEFFRGQETGGLSTKTYIVPQKKVLSEFMNSLEFVKMYRFIDYTLSSSEMFSNAIAEVGKQYAFYLFHGIYEGEWGAHFMPEKGNFQDTLTMNSVPTGVYSVDWIDPSSGAVISSESLKWDGGNLRLITPIYSMDLALRIGKKD